jgi:hypothetical protein
VNQEGEALKYLKTKFNHLSDGKIKEGICIGPQIRELLNDKKILIPFFVEMRKQHGKPSDLLFTIS